MQLIQTLDANMKCHHTLHVAQAYEHACIPYYCSCKLFQLVCIHFAGFASVLHQQDILLDLLTRCSSIMYSACITARNVVEAQCIHALT